MPARLSSITESRGAGWKLALAGLALAVSVVWGASYVGLGRYLPDRIAPAWLGGGRYLNSQVLRATKDMESSSRSVQVAKWSAGTSGYGVTRDIHYQGRRVALASASGDIYCVGVVFDIYMAACERARGRNFRLRGLSAANFESFRKDFYGVDGNRRTFVEAMTSRGLGVEIDSPRDSKPGDLVQVWRTDGSGHSGILMGWEYDDHGRAIGIDLWSTRQAAGQAVTTEYFQNTPGKFGTINPAHIYIVRPLKP